MNKLNMVATMIAASLISAGPALAGTEPERETNDTLGTAQQLTTDSSMVVSQAYIGNSPALTNDVDFFSIDVQAGDVVDIDIENGFAAGESVDTCIAVITPDGEILRYIDDNSQLVAINDDENTSLYQWDSLLRNVVFPTTGTYTVGVSNYSRCFAAISNGYTMGSGWLDTGDYDLVITGVSVPAGMQHVNISIKPGSGTSGAPINPKSRGKIPVAILSSESFDAMTVNRGSVTFGNTGNESSLSKCSKGGEDVNDDGLLDVVCHFNNQDTGFTKFSEEGVLKATLGNGTTIEGRGNLKVVPVKGRR